MAHLLLVDDDPEMTDLLEHFFRAEGHEVRVALNGQEGLAALAARRPDVVLLDVEMPILSGPGMAYRMFLHDCGDENIPVVLISGVLDLASVASVVGTPYFLAKPYTLSDVVALVRRALVERTAPRPAAGDAP